METHMKSYQIPVHYKNFVELNKNREKIELKPSTIIKFVLKKLLKAFQNYKIIFIRYTKSVYYMLSFSTVSLTIYPHQLTNQIFLISSASSS